MTSEKIFRAMRDIDIQLILDAAPDLPKKKTLSWQKMITIAACFCIIVIGAIGYYNVVLRGANAAGPVSIEYESVAEINEALGKETLYTDDVIAGVYSVSVSYVDDGSGNADLSNPSRALIRANEGGIRIGYYIIFNRNSVSKSHISGYDEQNLRLEINGITVHYSKIFDGSHHSQAKFIYDGDLYVIDVTSPEDNYDIRDYIDRILKEK